MGWTVNAARPSAIPVVLLLLALLAIPIFIVSAKGSETGVVLLTAAASATVMCVVCRYSVSQRPDTGLKTRWIIESIPHGS